jgi:WD40 repeat protein/energy-coupling factor transporter ATP-binding protein EcfA2
MGSGNAYDVFLSYAHSDEIAAAELNSWLCAQGFRTFFDRSALCPGLRWVPALEDAIGRSKAVAILVGKQGLGNTQQYERELALIRQTGEQKFPVIPVLMPGCDSPPTGFLQLLTWVDLSKGASVLEQSERLTDLRAALRGETVAASAVRASICPYRGLEPFREEDAAFFCGRDDAVRELAQRVQEHEFVAVVGPSGCGKSSLVFAGLLPKLRKQGRTAMWDVLALRPGKSPLRALAEAFGVPPDGAGPAAIDTWLEGEAAAYRAGDKDKLARIVGRRLDAAPERPDRLLIYVDQWEELYAMAPPPEDKELVRQHSADVDTFVALLVTAASAAGSRANVVMTVRADFYNPLIRNPLLAALLPKQQVNIPPMSRDDLRSAVETPAKMAGLSFAPPQLVDRILDDMGLEEGRLPLLQFALKETWGKREGARLTAEAYTEVGGVAGAIEKTAEDAYERLTPSQKDAARRLFLRLVTPGEGQVDTRARSAMPDDPEQRDIVSLFANPKTRLLVTGYETLQRAAQAGSEARSTVEVAHEALIQRWPTLRDWVRANRDNMRARAAVLRANAEWEENNESEKFLLDPGVQLERGRALVANPGDVAIDDILDFVERSIAKERQRLDAERQAALADQKRIADAERRAKEAAEDAAREAAARATAETKLRNLADRRATLWRRALVGSGAFLMVSLPSLGVYSWYLSAENTALRAKAIADRAEYSLANEGPAKAILIATQAEKLGLPDVPEIERVLVAALRQLHERREISGLRNPVSGIALSPDGTAIASLDNASIVFRGADKGETITEVSLPAPAKLGLTWSVAGDWLGLNYENRALLLRPCSHQEIRHLFPSCRPDGKDETVTLGGSLNAGGLPRFSSDGKWAVTASRIQPPLLWDIATQTSTPLATQIPAMPFGVSISPDGKWIAVGLANSEIDLVDPKNSGVVQRLKPKMEKLASVVAVEFNPEDPNMLAASLLNGEIVVWNISDRTFETLTGSAGIAYNLSFSRDGRYLAASGDDRVIRIWRTDRIASKEKPTQLRGHAGPVYMIAYNPVNNTLVSASQDRTIRIWDEHSPVARSEDGQSQADVGANPSEPPSWMSSVDLPHEFGEVTAYAKAGDRAIVASKDGKLASFIIGADRHSVANWSSPENVAALAIEHNPDRIVATSIRGKRYSWPFLSNIHALVQFADDHIPFDGDHRQALSHDDKCVISPADKECNADDALSDPP